MRPRQYCCCAIPIVNAGIYATIAEQFIVGFLVGILALATPAIVGASVPSYAPKILAILCFAAAGAQILGVMGVSQEKPGLYRTYMTIHILLTIASFTIAAVCIGISASNHRRAVTQCITTFYPTDQAPGGNDIVSEGETLCNIFTWVDVGLMGGLWAILAIAQLYLFLVISSFGTDQRADVEKYDAVNSFSNIAMATNRGEPWNSRPSEDYLGHNHNTSFGSVSTMLGEKVQQPRDGYSDNPTYPPVRTMPMHQPSTDDANLAHPSRVLSEEPTPTPQYADAYYSSDPTSAVDRPQPFQAHPAEGSFGRKTPRTLRKGSDFDGSFFNGRA